MIQQPLKEDVTSILHIQKLLKEKGMESLTFAQKAMLKELKTIKSEEIKKALDYFMTKYWLDVARPALFKLACEAFGGNCECIKYFSVPLILLSGGVDIHDDIIDQSKTKYGVKTVYGKYGKEIALLTGDALLFKGLMLFLTDEKVEKRKRHIILNIIKNSFFELGDAEALELKYKKQLISPAQYLKIIKRKAADVSAHMRVAAVLCGMDRKGIQASGYYGRLLGMSLILRDDILDVMDENELKNRVLNESLPAPIIFAAYKKEVKSDLEQIIKKTELSVDDVKGIIRLANEGGGFKKTKTLMEKLTNKGIETIKKFDKEGNLTKLLKVLIYDIETRLERFNFLTPPSEG